MSIGDEWRRASSITVNIQSMLSVLFIIFDVFHETQCRVSVNELNVGIIHSCCYGIAGRHTAGREVHSGHQGAAVTETNRKLEVTSF